MDLLNFEVQARSQNHINRIFYSSSQNSDGSEPPYSSIIDCTNCTKQKTLTCMQIGRNFVTIYVFFIFF
jgi:hypothetical protein